MLKKYFYRLLYHHFSIYIRPGDSVVEVDPQGIPDHFFENTVILRTKPSDADKYAGFKLISTFEDISKINPDYIILNGNIHYERDIQGLLDRLNRTCRPSTRVIFSYYSRLWKPVFRLATMMGLREKDPEQNWTAREDMENFLCLANFEPVIDESRVLLPVYIPIISSLLNHWLAPLPFFRIFCMLHILMARPLITKGDRALSVSVVVPARNEAGNIDSVVKRLPRMGPDDELIFVEGHSTDNTWLKIQEARQKFAGERAIIAARQDGQGKGDAVRKGFSLAAKDILMILDADLSVPPESLPLFYRAIVENKGEFINGSRLVYPMDERAMRFFNILGNKFFAWAFSFVLGQRFKDTLCGTKALSRENYQKIAAHRSFFGEFDPFGDFDLIFGAMRLGLKIREVPINYEQRTYGNTNIHRWRHGAILLRMLVYAARKIKFV